MTIVTAGFVYPGASSKPPQQSVSARGFGGEGDGRADTLRR